MATENNNKNLNVPNKREQSQTCLSYAERKEQSPQGNVPNLRFPEFSGEWEKHTLTEYLEFKNGLNPDSKRFGKGVKFISVMDILNNQYITYDKIISSVDVNDKELETYKVNYGDILFQRSSETFEDIGMANVYLDRKAAVFGGFVIRGKKIGDYSPLFFRYLLSTPFARKSIIVKGAGAQHFNIGQDGLSKVSLYFPPKIEQQKISSFLSLLDDRISTQIKIIEKLESLIKGIYERLFNIDGAAYIQLGNVAKIHKGQQINGEELSETGSYYVMNGGVVPSGYLEDFNTPANTISISEGGNSCGYVQYNGVPFWSGGHCYTLIDPITSFNYKYLFHYLKFKEQSIMALCIGSGLPNIQKKDLDSFPILNISKEEQDTIACVFDEILEKIVCERQIALKYEEQKRYLLSNLFI